MLRENLERTPTCRDERLALLDHHTQSVVAAIQFVLPEAKRSDVDMSGALASLIPLVDDGSLPALVDDVALQLGRLIDDVEDPEREALTGLLTIAQARSVLCGRFVFDLIQRFLSGNRPREMLAALIKIAGSRDATTLLSLLRLANPEADDFPGLECGFLPSSPAPLLLMPLGFGPMLGSERPAWAVYADPYINPRVAVDPRTETLYPPFVDRNADAVADVDLHGFPVDPLGEPIDLPVFSPEGERDECHRALAGCGAPIYEYFEASDTALSYVLSLAGRAISNGAHHDLLSVLAPALGLDDDARSRALPDVDRDTTPALDLATAGLETLRYERVATLLATWGALVNEAPETAEAILVSVGRVLEALNAGGLSLADLQLLDLFIEAVPLLGEFFAIDAVGQPSAARVLLDVIHELGTTARAFPEDLEQTMAYVNLDDAPMCGPREAEPQGAVLVDFNRPRYYHDGSGQLVDNRSAFEQLIELLADADCGSVPLTGGKTVSRMLVEELVKRPADEVCHFIDDVFAALGISREAGHLVVVSALEVIGCNGERVWASLESLRSLAQSGMLEALLPAAASFVQRGRLDSLLEIAHLLNRDLKRGEVSSGMTSTVRSALPSLVRVLRTRVPTVLFDLLVLARSIPSVDGQGSLEDVLVDSFAFLTQRHSKLTIHGRTIAETSLALEILNPYRRIAERLHRNNAADGLDRLLLHVSDLLAPAADSERLRDPRLRPALASLLGYSAKALEVTPEERACRISSLQRDIAGLLVSDGLTKGLLWLRDYSVSASASILDSLLVTALTPDRENPERDLFLPLTQIGSGLLQLPERDHRLQAAMRYVVSALSDPNFNSHGMLVALDSVLEHDHTATLLTAVQRLFLPIQELDDRAPIDVFTTAFMQIVSATPTANCEVAPARPWNIEGLEAGLRATVDFLFDNQYGIGAVFELIRLRSASSPSEPMSEAVHVDP